MRAGYKILLLIAFIAIAIPFAFGDPVMTELARHNKTEVFSNLISSSAGLTGGEAVFEMTNPMLQYDLPISELKINYNVLYGNPPESTRLYYYTSYIDSKIIPTYTSKCVAGGLDINGSATEVCNNVQNGSYVEKTLIENWIPFNITAIHPNETYRIKVVSTWKAELGLRKMDWIPELRANTMTIKQTDWAWYFAGDLYKRAIEVNTSSNISGYQLQIVTPWNANMLSDCADVRFTNASETAEYSYWRENYSSSVACKFWVRANLTTANGTQLYMYYGNTSAVNTTSNASTTFYANITSLKAFYSNDEGTGSITYDYSGYGNNGTWNNVNTTWGIGLHNNSVNITTKNNNQGINVTSSASLQITGDLTITGWVYSVAADPVNSVNSIIAKGYTKEFEFDVINAAAANQRWRLWRGSTNKQCGSTQLTLNTWANVMVTSSATQTSFYLNGTKICDVGSASAGIAGTLNMYLGNRAESVIYSPTMRFDDTAIFNQILSAGDMANITNATRRGLASLNATGNLLIRYYLNIEPPYAIGAEESNGCVPTQAGLVDCPTCSSITTTTDLYNVTLNFSGSGTVNVNARLYNFSTAVISPGCRVVLLTPNGRLG